MRRPAWLMTILLLALAYWLSPGQPGAARETTLPVEAAAPQVREVKVTMVQEEPPPPPKPQPAPKPVPKKRVNPPKQKSATAVAGAGQAGTINLIGEFDCSIEYYVAAMKRLGAQVVLYDNLGSRFYSLDARRYLAPLEALAGTYSPVTRRLTRDYPGGEAILSEARQRLGTGQYDILLLRPAELAARMDNMVEATLAGEDVRGGGSIFVRYRSSGGQLVMYVEKAKIGGRDIPIGRQFAL